MILETSTVIDNNSMDLLNIYVSVSILEQYIYQLYTSNTFRYCFKATFKIITWDFETTNGDYLLWTLQLHTN